ncbi:MAG: S-methyl-5-thioribose-1-phosphate isomerase [bacterium]|nr:S-methyl-5-thioribose-1-phosphate isomerase [bacterium]
MTSLPFPFPVVQWQDDRVVVLDQTLLPGQTVFLACATVPELGEAISRLAVRGAPAIGVAAAYGLALAARQAVRDGLDAAGTLAAVEQARRHLAATRPTAVNLFWALDRLAACAGRLAAHGPGAVAEGLLAEARRVHEEDIAMCRRLGQAGAALLPDCATVLTHCNAGGLATGGYGTALGVIYAAREAGKVVRVFADETRPLLQGARLTAWELADQGFEVTVLCEGAAGSLLRRGGIDAVITGADRIAANGDTANKIGTYPLAVLADRHDVPFYVAAPGSTFDPAMPDGSGIVIEQRSAAEVLAFGGTRTAPDGVGAWNPAFDVTPAALVTAFITEHGILRPPFEHSLAVFGPR